MKKTTNNKYRSNNNSNNNNYSNQIYSLNYRFDSSSPAGKCSGTALDLIKKYNELAKEAHGNNDYVEAEVFRQYAEHYRKIVTDINEKKIQYQQTIRKDSEKNENDSQNLNTNNATLNDVAVSAPQNSNNMIETEVVETIVVGVANDTTITPQSEKREFKIIEIAPSETKSELIDNLNASKTKTPRAPRRKVAAL